MPAVELYVNGILTCVPFRVWLFLLGITFLKLTQVIAHIVCSCLLLYTIPLFDYSTLTLYPAIAGHLGSFQLRAIQILLPQVFSYTPQVHVSVGCVPRSGIARPSGIQIPLLTYM